MFVGVHTCKLWKWLHRKTNQTIIMWVIISIQTKYEAITFGIPAEIPIFFSLIRGWWTKIMHLKISPYSVSANEWILKAAHVRFLNRCLVLEPYNGVNWSWFHNCWSNLARDLERREYATSYGVKLHWLLHTTSRSIWPTCPIRHFCKLHHKSLELYLVFVFKMLICV